MIRHCASCGWDYLRPDPLGPTSLAACVTCHGAAQVRALRALARPVPVARVKPLATVLLALLYLFVLML